MTLLATSISSIPASPTQTATSGKFGFLPGSGFRLTTGECQDCTTIPQALWFFRKEPIATPLPDQPIAGFTRSQRARDDVATWHAETPVGSAIDFPPLVWVAATSSISGAQLSADGREIDVSGTLLPLSLAERHPLNRSYFDEKSVQYFGSRPVDLRGDMHNGAFVARTFWPADFRLPAAPVKREVDATPEDIRRLVREQADGGAKSPFAVESLWLRPNSPPLSEGRPVLGFILNGAQGDDDEAHGGHFATAVGRIGPQGSLRDWLVANYYTLDSESEKGILAAPVPLDNYFGDLNSGQSWYRPSYMIVTVLRNERTAVHIQSALGRVFNQFYRHQFSYQHARANCTGISVSTLRALDWQVPAAGPESWLKAVPALPVVAITTGSLGKGKAAFDYLTEDRTRLYPAVALEQIGADLLRLAHSTTARPLSEFERMLADDIDAILFVRIPQFPSSRAWGNYPITSSQEYRNRVPKNPEEQEVVPVGPRPFPKDFIDPQAPGESPLRSDYAVAGYLVALAGLGFFGLRWLLRRFRRK